MQSYDPSSPWNLNYERALLGNILLCADADRQPKSGFEKVPPENYFLLDHQQLAAALFEMFAAEIQPAGPILYDWLLKKYPPARATELIAYASSLSDGVPFLSPNYFYAGWINRHAAMRSVQRLQRQVGEASPERVAQLEKKLAQALAEVPPEPSPKWPR